MKNNELSPRDYMVQHQASQHMGVPEEGQEGRKKSICRKHGKKFAYFMRHINLHIQKLNKLQVR